jgi:hypothetical protein
VRPSPDLNKLLQLPFLKIPESFEGIQNLYLDTDLGTLDIVGEVIEIGNFQQVAKKAKRVSLFGLSIKIIENMSND